MEHYIEAVRKSNMDIDTKEDLDFHLRLLNEAMDDERRIEKDYKLYVLLEHRGFKLSYPFRTHSYVKFHLFNDEKHYTVICGSGFTSGGGYICLEALGDGDVERFSTIDEIIDWIENDEMPPDDDE